MTCRPIKLLIGWLLMTSPKSLGNINGRNNAGDTSTLTNVSDWYVSQITDSTTDSLHLQHSLPTSPSVEADANISDLTSSGINDNITQGVDSDTDAPTSPSSEIPLYLRGEGIMTSQDYEDAVYLIKMVTAPVMLLGILTNLLTILVYRRMPRTVTSTFFTLATGLDIGFLLTGIPPTLALLTLGQRAVMRDSFYLSYGLYVNNYVTNTLRKVIVCVTMLLSVDRYLRVAFPLRTRQFSHLRRPKLYTLIVAVLVFLLDTNVLFKFKVMELPSSTNSTDFPTLALETTSVYEARRQMFFDLSLTSSFIFQYIPLIVLVVCNMLLVTSLVKYSYKTRSLLQNRETINSSRSQSSEDTNFSPSVLSCETEDDIIGQVPQVEDQRADGHSKLGRRRVYVIPVARHVSAGVGENQTSEVAGKTERQKSVTVLMYSFIFTLLALPNTTYPLLRKLIPGFSPFDRLHFLTLTLGHVFFLLDSVSSAMNFFIYFVTGSAFRAGVFRFFSKARHTT